MPCSLFRQYFHYTIKMSKNFVTFVHYNCTEQIYKHFKQNKQMKLKNVFFVVIYIRSKLF